MRKDRVFLIACFVVVAIITVCAVVRPAPMAYESASQWHRSSDVAPPESEPFVAFYIWDGYPSPMVVHCINGRYYVYNPGDQLMLIAEYPPSYWVDMPGKAE